MAQVSVFICVHLWFRWRIIPARHGIGKEFRVDGVGAKQLEGRLCLAASHCFQLLRPYTLTGSWLTRRARGAYTPPMSSYENPPRWRRWLRAAAWLILGIAILALLIQYWQPLLALVSQQERLRQWIAEFGWAAPLALILVQAAQVILAPIPGQAVGLVSGYLFGTLLGTVYSMIGVLLGAWAVMALARRLGRPFAERFVPARHMARFDGLAERGGPAAFFLLFLLPFVPDDSISILAGLTRTPLALLMILAAIGRFPSILASSFIGDRSGNLTPLQWAALAGVALAVGVPILAYKSRLGAFVERLAVRFGKER